MNALAGGHVRHAPRADRDRGPRERRQCHLEVALLPGAATSAWAFRDELGPVVGIDMRLLAAITFVGGLAGSVQLAITPTRFSISSSRGCCSPRSA